MKQSSAHPTLLPSARVARNPIGSGIETATSIAAAAFLAATIAWPLALRAQDAPVAAPQTQAAPDASQPMPRNDISLSNQKPAKKAKAPKERKQDEKVVLSKDSKKADKKSAKTISLTGRDDKLPDKALFDKAQDAIKHGRYDVGRIDLQTLLNTYPESKYMMQSKLAIADSWYKEGGTAALTQAEQEYKDFITFFPNAPEAAEAQMRVGDIYFRQMDKPDRDYTKTQQAEQEYRLMLQQFPDSALVPQAKQRLREVQETMAFREASVADFYATRQNWSAVIARYQTVIDTYPLYSRMDEVLIGMGDAYEGLAHTVRLTPRLPEDTKARLLKIYDSNAQDAYDKVVLEHSASAHVEDARDRLVGMNLPVPTPTPEEVAASSALENSRGSYTLSKRAMLLFMRQADTVPAATIGDPTLEDPKLTVAPDVIRKVYDAMNPGASAARPAAVTNSTAAATADAAAAPAPAASNAPLALENVPTAGAAPSSGPAVDSNATVAAPATGSSGSGVGIEIVQPSGNSRTPATPGNTTFPGADGAVPPASSVDPAQPPATAKPNPPDNGGVTAVGPPANTQLAPVQHADKAPDAINEVKPGPPAVGTQTAATDTKKNPKPAYDSDQESSSKHKPKKGLKKLNPF